MKLKHRAGLEHKRNQNKVAGQGRTRSGAGRKGGAKRAGRGEAGAEREAPRPGILAGPRYIVGTYHQAGHQRLLAPCDRRLDMYIPIRDMPPAERPPKEGAIVEIRCEVPRDLKPRRGQFMRAIGLPGEFDAEMARCVAEQSFEEEFHAPVRKEALALPAEVQEADKAGRRDVRGDVLVTIDPETARDFDDAVGVIPAPKGMFGLRVAIADVSAYVPVGSALDGLAADRTTSVYLPHKAIPMLPEGISGHLASLKPDTDRLAMVCDMHIDAAGVTRKTEVYPAVMRSRARLTYEQAHRHFEGGGTGLADEVAAALDALRPIDEVLRRMRLERGALELNIQEPKVVMDGKRVVDVVRAPRFESNKMIESFMLAANEAVAHYCVREGLDTIFRVHAEPDEDKLVLFLERAGMAEKLDGKPRPGMLNRILAEVAGKPSERALNQLLLRSLMMAEYSAGNIGHYGLGAPAYLHFTSPIRRYPDLVVHRLLKAHLSGAPSPHGGEALREMALRSSERERGAMMAERAATDLCRALLLRDRIGEEFDAVVSTVAEFGIFVELAKPFAEGLVPVGALSPGEYMIFDEDVQQMRGSKSGKTYSVGDAVRVRLTDVNVSRRQSAFALAAPRGENGARAGRPQAGAVRSGKRQRDKR